MDDTPAEALKKAYEQNPGNVALLFILLESLHQAKEHDQALSYLQKQTGTFTDEAQRVLAGTIALSADKPDMALSYCSSHSPGELLVQAKAYRMLFRNEEGLACYQDAVARNPALEDPELEKSLQAKVTDVSHHADGKVIQLRLLSKQEEETPHRDASAPEPPEWIKAEKTTVTFKDVGGLEDVKKHIHRKIILPFSKPSLFQKFKKRAGGGVLLYGPPGCGKTLIARATAGECQATFYNIAVSDILDMWVGNSDMRLHAIFEQARRTAPSVLFFDELEAVAGKRQSNTDSAVSRMVSQFLSEMDGFDQNNQGVLVLGATNVPWSIDPAFRRPGRFDRIQFVPPPDKEARLAILRILMTDRPQTDDVNLDYLAKMTSGFSGADLSHLVETACDIAIEESISQGKEVPLSAESLKDALKDVNPTTLEWLATVRNYANYSNEGGQYDDVLEFLRKHGK